MAHPGQERLSGREGRNQERDAAQGVDACQDPVPVPTRVSDGHPSCHVVLLVLTRHVFPQPETVMSARSIVEGKWNVKSLSSC